MSEQPPPPRSSRPLDPHYIWSLGIYAGSSALAWGPAPGASNPVLTARDVSDVPAAFLADPFMLFANDAWFMFFEIMHRERRVGEIGLATSSDGLRWEYRKVVLRENFHLSYPCVFSWQGAYYMVPETVEADAVRLYRADPFPDRWIHVADLLQGRFADSTLFRFQESWWMFTCPRPNQCDALSLYMAGELTGPWRQHPLSPMIEGDKRKARPAGRIVVKDGKVIRYAQDCFPTYGSRVRAFEVELTPSSYRETELQDSPVLKPDGSDWNGSGMHQIDPHPYNGGWIACVDGLCRDWLLHRAP